MLTRRDTYPTVTLHDIQISQSSSAKYLGIHLDRKLTWWDNIFAKRKQLGMQCRKINWLINKQSPPSLENKLCPYGQIEYNCGAQLKYRNCPTISIKNLAHHCKCTKVHHKYSSSSRFKNSNG